VPPCSLREKKSPTVGVTTAEGAGKTKTRGRWRKKQKRAQGRIRRGSNAERSIVLLAVKERLGEGRVGRSPKEKKIKS